MASLRHHLANLVSVLHTMIELSLKKVFYPHNIFFAGIERFSPDVVVDTDKKSKIVFGKRVSIHSRSRMAANSGGQLIIKTNVSFNVGCIVVCKKRIEIGKNVSFGPNVMVYDHDHIMDFEKGVGSSPFKCDEIVVGDNTWIGAGAIILSGTHIGKNCIIAAGSVVKGDIPDNTTLIQKRENTYISIGRNDDRS